MMMLMNGFNWTLRFPRGDSLKLERALIPRVRRKLDLVTREKKPLSKSYSRIV
jgi:hypothetical protein